MFKKWRDYNKQGKEKNGSKKNVWRKYRKTQRIIIIQKNTKLAKTEYTRCRKKCEKLLGRKKKA